MQILSIAWRQAIAASFPNRSEIFQGLIDLVAHEGRDLGRREAAAASGHRIPEDMVESQGISREAAEAASNSNDEFSPLIRRQRPDEPRQAHDPQGRLTLVLPVSVQLGLQEQGLAAVLADGRGCIASPVDVPAIRASMNATKIILLRMTRNPLALLAFKIMTTLPSAPSPFPHLLRHACVGTPRHNSTRDRKERIGRMLLTRQQPRRHKNFRGAHCRAGRPKEARTATRWRGTSRYSGKDESGAGDRDRDRAKSKSDQKKLCVALAKLAAEILRSVSTDLNPARPFSRAWSTHLDIMSTSCATYKVDANMARRRWAFVSVLPSARSRLHHKQNRRTGIARFTFIVAPNNQSGVEFESGRRARLPRIHPRRRKGPTAVLAPVWARASVWT